MAYYSAHYTDESKAYPHVSIEFGRERGIAYLFKTTNYREAIDKAQKVATETGKTVHFCKTYAIAGRGLAHEWREVYPVRSKIKVVRMYKEYRENWYDVIYHSGRVVCYTEPYLPNTVEQFIQSSTIRKEQHDKTFNRDEMLYY